MGFLKTLARKINNNFIVRNVVLAVCAVIVFSFVVSVLLNLATRHGQVREVPDFMSMTFEEAEHAARPANLDLVVTDSMYISELAPGTILEQNPAAGAKVKSGRRVLLTINSLTQRTAVIPFVEGYSLRQACNILVGKGFEVASLNYVEDIATNNVISQSYKGEIMYQNSNIEAEVGSGITLNVGYSAETPAPTVASLSGFSLKEAKNRIWESGFNVGKITSDKDITPLNIGDARVYKQSPAAGVTGEYGSDVSIYLTLDQAKYQKVKGKKK